MKLRFKCYFKKPKTENPYLFQSNNKNNMGQQRGVLNE